MADIAAVPADDTASMARVFEGEGDAASAGREGKDGENADGIDSVVLLLHAANATTSDSDTPPTAFFSSV